MSDSTAIKLMQHRKRTGTVAPQRQGRPPGSGKLAAYWTFLIGAVEDKPDITMPELARRREEAMVCGCRRPRCRAFFSARASHIKKP